MVTRMFMVVLSSLCWLTPAATGSHVAYSGNALDWLLTIAAGRFAGRPRRAPGEHSLPCPFTCLCIYRVEDWLQLQNPVCATGTTND